MAAGGPFVLARGAERMAQKSDDAGVQADVTAGLADVLAVKSKDQLEATRAGGALAVQVIPDVFSALILSHRTH